MSQPKTCPSGGASSDDLIAFCAKDGAVTRITRTRQRVRCLYDDLAPWRDAPVGP